MSNWANYHWNNPPPPFNPDYKPYAKEVSRLVVKELEDEGWYDETTLEQRQAINLYATRYKQKMKEYESNNI